MSDPKVGALGSNTHGFLARLQPRERTVVLAGVIVVFVMALALLFFFRGMRLAELEEEVADLRAGIELTLVLVGWLLGGAVGIGTVVFALGIGPAVSAGLYLTARVSRVSTE